MIGIFGNIQAPDAIQKYIALGNGQAGSGLLVFLSNLFKLAGVIGGIYMVFQIIIAGYSYLSANGDPKNTEKAWAQIWQSLLGMVIIGSAFVLAGVIGRITGINILNPTIYGPGP